MKRKQIQSYLSTEDYNQLKEIANKQGLLFATLVRQIIINYLKTSNNEK
jgi:predicted DNA binding CopG/RHH family protein